MKNLIFIGMAALLLGSCKTETATTTVGETAPAAAAPTADKTSKRQDVKGMPSEEATKLLGLKTAQRNTFSGYYEYYEAGGQKILHGKFELKSEDDMGTFLEKNGKGEPGTDEYMAAMFDFQGGSYAGQFVEGKLDGKLTFELEYYESGGKGYLTFDGKGGCGEGEYLAGEGGACYAYKGKAPNCQISDLQDTKEVECE